jgi:hypothetical protein
MADLSQFGVDPDEPEVEETRYEFETQAGPWEVIDPVLDETETTAKPRCPNCGYKITKGPVLLDYGRDDGLVLACKLCQDCHNIFPSHTASNPDFREPCSLSYPRNSLRLYEPLRVTDDEYPNWDLHQLLELDGDLSGGENTDD